MPYELYKLLHVLFVVLFIGSAAITLYADIDGKFWKILNGLVSFLIFVAGMGLLARIGVKHSEGWPLWVQGKVLVWLLAVAFAPIAAKRLRAHRDRAFTALMSLIAVAVWFAIYKPL